MHNATVLAAAFMMLAAGAAHAQHAGSYTGRRGNTTTWNTDVSHGTATGSVTGPNGYTTSGSGTARYEGGGAYGVTGTATGPRGSSVSGSGTIYKQ